MIILNGQNYESSMVTPISTAPAAQAYGGRTCVGTDPLATVGSFYVEVGLINQILGRCYASTDTPAMGWHLQLRFAFQSLTQADGSTGQLFIPTLVLISDTQGNTTFDIIIKRTGATYTLYCRAMQGGNTYEFAVANVSVGTTFHNLDWWIFSDKHLAHWDGVYVDEAAYGISSTAIRLYRLFCTMSAAGYDLMFEHLLFGREEYSGTATIDRSTTNGSPDNGKLYWITKTAFGTEVTAGDAGEIAISDGDVDTSSLPVSEDILLTKVLTGNNGGWGQKITTDGSGNVTLNEWSL